MKKLCFLLAAMLLLCGCSAKSEPAPLAQNFSYSVSEKPDGGNIDGVLTYQGGALINGSIEETKPTDGTVSAAPTDATVSDIPDATELPQEISALVGTWEYVDTIRSDAYVLTINEFGGVEIAQYYCKEDGSRSCFFRMSCPLEIVDGLITFSGDTEYDPPSLVLKPVYEEGVGDILRVVSSASNFSELTEYFYRCS